MTASLTLVALAVVTLTVASGGAWGHELKAEVLRESDLLRFSTARRPTDSERNKMEAQACDRAKFAARNQLVRSRHSRSMRYSECSRHSDEPTLLPQWAWWIETIHSGRRRR